MIIKSILDNDLYTFTVGQAVFTFFKNSIVEYKFTSRKSTLVNEQFINLLKEEINNLSKLFLSEDEYSYLEKECSYLSKDYLIFLKNFKFDPNQISIEYDNSKPIDLKDNFSLIIKGPWIDTIFWEVPLLALISECYFKTIKCDWTYDGQVENIDKKSKLLTDNDIKFIEFGTRRRRSFNTQDLVVQKLKESPNLIGTSNVYLAKKYNIKPIGTMSHQWIMGCSGLVSLKHANKVALEKWTDLYDDELGIALTDTLIIIWQKNIQELDKIQEILLLKLIKF